MIFPSMSCRGSRLERSLNNPVLLFPWSHSSSTYPLLIVSTKEDEQQRSAASTDLPVFPRRRFIVLGEANRSSTTLGIGFCKRAAASRSPVRLWVTTYSRTFPPSSCSEGRKVALNQDNLACLQEVVGQHACTARSHRHPSLPGPRLRQGKPPADLRVGPLAWL